MFGPVIDQSVVFFENSVLKVILRPTRFRALRFDSEITSLNLLTMWVW